MGVSSSRSGACCATCIRTKAIRGLLGATAPPRALGLESGLEWLRLAAVDGMPSHTGCA